MVCDAVAPLDLDKQCGVIQGPNNTPCTRSLTCKSHSMGAKRAVAGRSQPYDVLLSAYQKKAIGRPQSTGASASTNKAAVVAKATKTNARKLQNQTASPGLAGATANATDNVQANEEHYVNSDEEVESVIQAIRQSCPAPLAEKPFYFVKRRRQCYRLRDILLDTITPKAAPMAHSDSNSSLSSLFNTSPSVHASPLHSQQPSTPQQQQQQQQQTQLHLPHHAFQSAAMMNSSPASAAMNRISQPALGSTGMGGPPLGMIGFSGSMDAGSVFASTNGAVRDT
ncbi:SCA7, zinc-binding domain-containing protein [Fennellomyces sp. T-0311]|nr:SCA7, zinc-binding domain-containing protein [Fennellomyces sp. T-0311]